MAMSGSAVVNALLKQSVDRARPQLFPPEAPTNGWAFPSGHAQSTMAMLAVLGVLLW